MIPGITASMRRVTGGGGDPYWDNVVALLHFDGDFTDAAGGSWTPVGGVSISSARYVFDGESAEFNGINGRMERTIGLEGDDGAVTIEGWLYRNHNSTPMIFVSKFLRQGERWHVGLETNGVVRFFRVTRSITQTLDFTFEVPVQEWFHFALTVDSGRVARCFINGQQAPEQHTTPYNLDIGSTLHIGSRYAAAWGHWYDGYIDEFRNTKGVARYTENFTPPTEPFPNFGP